MSPLPDFVGREQDSTQWPYNKTLGISGVAVKMHYQEVDGAPNRIIIDIDTSMWDRIANPEMWGENGNEIHIRVDGAPIAMRSRWDRD